MRVDFIRRNIIKNFAQYHKVGTTQDMMGKLKVLDVGCGAGILSESLARIGMGTVVGIDPTPKCIEMAEGHLDLDKDNLQDQI